MVYRALGLRQDDNRGARAPGAGAARPPRRVARRRRGARAPLQGPRLLEGRPRHEYRSNRLGRLSAYAARRGGDLLRDLALPGGAAQGARDGRGARRVRRGLRGRLRRGVRPPRREGGLRLRQGARGRAVLPHDRPRPPGRGAALRAEAALPRRSRHRLRAPRARVPGARARSGRDPRAVRRARLAARRRLPDAKPDPSRARVPDEGRARDRRRAPDPSAGRRDQVRRRPRRDACRVLPRAARELLPSRSCRPVELPGRDALRRAPRGDLARHLPQELRLLALHRRPRPRGRRRLLRHVRRPADLRRVRAARARHRAHVLRARLLLPRLRADGDAEDVPALRRRPRLPLGDEGARAARGGRAAAGRVLPARSCRGADRDVPRDRMTWEFSLTGLLIGVLVGLTGMGGGTFFGLVMLLVYPLAARRIVGTDIFHAAALLWVAGIGYLALGKVDLHAMAWLLVGSIPGVLIGSQLGIGLPDRPLRAALATTLVLSGVKVVGVPESSWIIVGALVAGALALGAWKLAQREARRPVPVRAGDSGP